MPGRNQEAYFSELPQIEIQRSIFDRTFNHKTSFNVGQVIPFFCSEVIPGSTHNFTTSIVARLQTLLAPIMDNMYLDTYYFFVPMRLVWDHTKNFFGENENGPWTKDAVKYQIPYLNYPQAEAGPDGTTIPAGFDEGSIADYLGIPINRAVADSSNSKNKPSALPFRAYALIINEFFRDQNLQQPVVVHKDETIRRGVHVNSTIVQNPDGTWPEPYVTDLELGGAPFIAARYHDYFSSCLPQPQRGESISIFGNLITDATYAPVSTLIEKHDGFDSSNMIFKQQNGTYRFLGTGAVATGTGVPASSYQAILSPEAATGTYADHPVNLWANLNIPEATITQLRLAFQLQKFYERSAVAGSRYREYLSGFFGVSNGDSRMQVPEYLGGHRIPLTIHQVANTGKTADADLGDLGAMSNTSDVHEDFHMSFSEHGYLMGLCVVRYDNTYSQGLEQMWSRRDVLDFYNPVFAHISEQPVYAREIGFGLPDYLGSVSEDILNQVFGYNEAWASYRYLVSRCSAEMRPESSRSLASWHLADDYAQVPILGAHWLQTDVNTVDRVLAVSHTEANQVFCDIFIKDEAVMPMPVHSVPGLADHF